MAAGRTLQLFWLVATALYLVPLGWRPLCAPDEFRYAEIPREMIETGDWVSPRLLGVRYFEKPVLGYWLTAASMKVFGDCAFAHRLPPALGALGAALLLVLLVRRRRESAIAARAAALVFLSSLFVFGIGTFNVLDSQLNCFTTGTLVCFFLGFMAPPGRERWWWILGSGVFCGLAFLTKGFLAFAVPVLTLLPFALWERRLRDFLLLSPVPLLVSAVVALPWSLAIHAREPGFWHRFFWVEHVGRFTSGGADHSEPFWYLVPFLLLGALPWTAQLPAAWIGLRQRGFHDPLLRFAACWAAVPFLFFSMSSGKLGTYVLPSLAPLSLLISLGLVRYCQFKTPGPWFRRSAVHFGRLLLALAIGLPVVELLRAPEDRLYGTDALTGLILVELGLLLWGGLSLLASRLRSAPGAILTFALAPGFLFVTAGFAMPPAIEARLAHRRTLERLADRIPKDAVIVVGREYSHSAAWTFRRRDLAVLRLGELEYGFVADPGEHYRVALEMQFGAFLERQRLGRPVAVLIERRYYQRILDSAGPPEQVEVGERLVLALYRGRAPEE